MSLSKTFKQIATATALCALISSDAVDARRSRGTRGTGEGHPILEQPEHVQSMGHSDGGMSIRLDQTNVEKLSSFERSFLVKKNKKLMAEKRKAPWYRQLWSKFRLQGQADETITLQDYFDVIYTGSIFLGDNTPTSVEVIFDTGSNWTIVFDQDTCTTCGTKGYAPSAHTSQTLSNPLDTATRTFGSAVFDGQWATDIACVISGDADTCFSTQLFMVTAAQGDVSTYGGIVGLSTGNPEPDGTFSDDLYIDDLDQEDAARLDSRLFAFLFQGASSVLDIGALRPEAMRSDGIMTYIDVEENDFWWSASISGVRFGDLDKNEWGVTPKLAMVDSGASCTYVPSDVYTWFIDYVKTFTFNTNEYSAWSSELGTIVSCDHKEYMPTLQLLLGGYWVELQPEHYVQPIYQDGFSTGECYICIQDYGSDDRWILGNTFMQGYYTAFNMDTQQFGFAPGAASSKQSIESGTSPTRFAELDVGLVAGFSVGIAALLGVSIWLIVRYLCKGIAPLAPQGSLKKSSVVGDLASADTDSLLKALKSLQSQPNAKSAEPSDQIKIIML